MKKYTTETLSKLKSDAQHSTRLRSHLTIHDSHSDPVQQLFIGMESDTYIRPHSHPDPELKELIILISGSCTCVIFDETGKITEQFTLSKEAENIACELPTKSIHSIICHQNGTIIIESKKGPFSPIPKEYFASWAPEEGSNDALPYLNKLKERLELHEHR
jgi:cupin fold WbuC family metalloprotein